MRVRMKTNIGGSREGEPWPAKGECLDLPEHQAADLIANGYAEEAPGEDNPEQPDAPTGDEPQDGAAGEPDAPTVDEPQDGAGEGGQADDEPVAPAKPKRRGGKAAS